MPTVLATPQILSQITHATVDGWTLNLVRSSGQVAIDPGKSTFAAIVNLRDQNGSVAQTQKLEANGTELPAPLVAAIRDMHTAVLAALRAAGKLPAGTDTEDI